MALLGTAALMGFAAELAQASTILFNFAGLPNNTGPGGADNSTAVANYMDGLLHNTSMGGNAKWNVTVAGAQSSGAAGGTAGDAGYAADAHPSGRVVCKTGTGSNCVPDTLATIYNTPFIMTSNSQTVGSKGISLGGSSYVSGSSSLSGASYISMAFTNVSPAPAVEVTSLTFDYEIFPNDVETAPNPAEFTFIMTAGGSTIADACTQAVAPSSGSTAKNCTVTSSTICSGTSVTTSDVSSYSLTGRASPSTDVASELDNPETNDQYIGTMTFNFTTPVSDPTLYFVHWPAEVAVTNIDWGLPLTTVPEPTSLLLFGTGLIGMGIFGRRKARAA